MSLARREPRSIARLGVSLAVLLAGALPARGACPDCFSLVAHDAAGSPIVVLARDTAAAAAGDLFGDAADEWVAALPGGGLFFRPGDGSDPVVVPGFEARALAIAGRKLYVALAGGGLSALDPETGEATPFSPLAGVSLAAGDFDGDGVADLVVLIDGGGAALIQPDTGEAVALEGLNGAELGGGDFLGRGHDQLAVLSSSGVLHVTDLLAEDSSLCFFGALGPSPRGGAWRPHGLGALPSGIALTLDHAGSPVGLSLESCEMLQPDVRGLEVVFEPVFTSFAAPTTVVPPCPIEQLTCAPSAAADSVEVSWSVDTTADCGCERIEVRTDAGVVLATLGGTASAAALRCDDVTPGSRIQVACIGSSGVEATAECAAPTCSMGGGLQLPGDCNQDRLLDLSDAVCMLGHLFLGRPEVLPCGDGTVVDPANATLLDSNGDRKGDLSDAVFLLIYLFSGGPPPSSGRECLPIAGCPEVCSR